MRFESCAWPDRRKRAAAGRPTGRRALSGSGDDTLRLWDLESGQNIATFTGENVMRSCAVAPDGRTIIAGAKLGRVHFLRLVESLQSAIQRSSFCGKGTSYICNRFLEFHKTSALFVAGKNGASSQLRL